MNPKDLEAPITYHFYHGRVPGDPLIQTRSYSCSTRPPEPCGCPDRAHDQLGRIDRILEDKPMTPKNSEALKTIIPWMEEVWFAECLECGHITMLGSGVAFGDEDIVDCFECKDRFKLGDPSP